MSVLCLLASAPSAVPMFVVAASVATLIGWVLHVQFSKQRKNGVCLEQWCCEAEIKTGSKITTPLGNRVTVVKPYVDIWYEIVNGEIVLHNVTLAKNRYFNVIASRTGERFRINRFEAPEALRQAVEKDLETAECRLRRKMVRNWDPNAKVEMA